MKGVVCMPPLLEEEKVAFDRETGGTKFGGTACEYVVKSYFLYKGINIAEPHVDDGVDLLIERPEVGWVRGQVKKVVYQNKVDSAIRRRTGKEVYRSRFNFCFQGGGSPHHLKNGRRQRRPDEIDFFYHVLFTKYRQLIWEMPSNIIPLTKDGAFIQSKCKILDRYDALHPGRKADFDLNDYVISKQFSPIIFESFPDFFLEKNGSLEPFFN